MRTEGGWAKELGGRDFFFWVGGCDWGCGENSNELMCCVEDRELNV